MLIIIIAIINYKIVIRELQRILMGGTLLPNKGEAGGRRKTLSVSSRVGTSKLHQLSTLC